MSDASERMVAGFKILLSDLESMKNQVAEVRGQVAVLETSDRQLRGQLAIQPKIALEGLRSELEALEKRHGVMLDRQGQMINDLQEWVLGQEKADNTSAAECVRSILDRLSALDQIQAASRLLGLETQVRELAGLWRWLNIPAKGPGPLTVHVDSSLSWTKELPTKPGYYWRRALAGDLKEPAIPTVVVGSGKDMFISLAGTYSRLDQFPEVYEWYGPIQPPK